VAAGLSLVAGTDHNHRVRLNSLTRDSYQNDDPAESDAWEIGRDAAFSCCCCRSGEADVQDEVSEPQIQDSAAGPVHDERQQDDGEDDDHQPEEEHDDSGKGVPGYCSRSSHGLQLPGAARLIRNGVSSTTACMLCSRPSHDNTHEIAQRVTNTDYIDGDVNDPGSILGITREKLDFTQPVAIMLMGMLGHIGHPAENDDAYTQSIVATLRAVLPSGGNLALNGAVDTDQDANKALDDYNQTGAVPYRARRRDQIVRFFDGLELVDPGPRWCRQ
jgi:S-adenosyl methyltransferase